MCAPADIFLRISKLVFEKGKTNRNDNETTKIEFCIEFCMTRQGVVT